MAACRRPDRGRERGPSRTCTVRIGESCPAKGAANQPFSRLPVPTATKGWSSSKPRFNSRSCVNLGTIARLPAGRDTLGGRRIVAQQGGNRLSLRDGERPSRHIGKRGVMADTQQVEDGRREVLGFESTLAWVGAVAVARAEDLSAADAGTGECEAEDISPVIAPAVSVDPGRAAEFPNGHDQGLAEQAAIGEVVEERRETNVEDRAQHVLKAVGVLGVRVPEGVRDGLVAGISRPVDVNQPRPRFHQPSSENQRLAPLVPARSVLWSVAVPDASRTPGDLFRRPVSQKLRASAGRRSPWPAALQERPGVD